MLIIFKERVPKSMENADLCTKISKRKFKDKQFSYQHVVKKWKSAIRALGCYRIINKFAI